MSNAPLIRSTGSALKLFSDEIDAPWVNTTTTNDNHIDDVEKPRFKDNIFFLIDLFIFSLNMNRPKTPLLLTTITGFEY